MPNVKPETAIPTMPSTSDSDARAMAALGGTSGGPPTDPNPTATAARAAASMEDDLTKGAPVKGGPSGQEKANGGDMTPGPALNKGKKKKDDEDDDEEETAKSLAGADAEIAEDDLTKALDSAIEIARGATNEPDPDRRAELADKLSKGEISSEEAVELTALVKSHIDTPEGEPSEEDLSKSSYTEAALSDPDVTAGHKEGEIDISGWIARQTAFVGGSLDKINTEVKEGLVKGFGDLGRFNLAMAKANRVLGQRVLEQQDMIKSLTGRLEVVEDTPEPRRAAPCRAVGSSADQELAADRRRPGDPAAQRRGARSHDAEQVVDRREGAVRHRHHRGDGSFRVHRPDPPGADGRCQVGNQLGQVTK